MTNAATKIITATIVAFALASAVLATPAFATSSFPADMEKAAASNASSQCVHSRFGCSIGGR